MSFAQERRPLIFYVWLLVVFAASLLMARANDLTFPYPGVDGVRFFLPSWSLAVRGTLKPVILNAPNGIYWVPHAYYVWLAFFMRLFGPTMAVAKTVNQVSVAAAAVIVTIAHARIAGSRFFAGLCALLWLSPLTIFTANTVRMESLVLLLYAVALLLHTYNRYVLAACTIVFSLLAHPAMLFAAAFYLPAAVALSYAQASEKISGRSRRWFTASDLLAVVLVLAAFTGEGLLIFSHRALFHEHMAFQIARKEHRDAISLLFHIRGLMFAAEVASVAAAVALLWRGKQTRTALLTVILPVALVALGLQLYSMLGAEIDYGVYVFAAIPSTFFCLIYRVAVLAGRNGEQRLGRNDSQPAKLIHLSS